MSCTGKGYISTLKYPMMVYTCLQTLHIHLTQLVYKQSLALLTVIVQCQDKLL